MFVPGRPHQTSLIFENTTGAYPSDSHYCRLLVLTINIILIWESFPGTNVLELGPFLSKEINVNYEENKVL
jgi:hypothetical protein